MRIAIITEISSSTRNADVINAIQSVKEVEVLNVGMKNPDEQPLLTYIHTGYMSALLLYAGVCDFVVGGCGTGQGYFNTVLQFPDVACGLIIDPVDAWLFSQINGGNCISLPFNKGYGWAADINLKYIFEKLFLDPVGQGFPPHRAESQANSRAILKRLSKISHKSVMEILRESDRDILQTISRQDAFMGFMEKGNADSGLILEFLRSARN